MSSIVAAQSQVLKKSPINLIKSLKVHYNLKNLCAI